MDITISAAQGAGKTRMALSIVLAQKDFRGTVTPMFVYDLGEGEDAILNRIETIRPDALIFDGCLVTSVDFIAAEKIAKAYRLVKPQALAVYLKQTI